MILPNQEMKPKIAFDMKAPENISTGTTRMGTFRLLI